MFNTSDVTELSYEEQLELVQARSKFDAPDILSTSSGSEPDEEDLLQIALQKSTDPSEQIDLDNRVNEVNLTVKSTNLVSKLKMICYITNLLY